MSSLPGLVKTLCMNAKRVPEESIKLVLNLCFEGIGPEGSFGLQPRTVGGFELTLACRV